MMNRNATGTCTEAGQTQYPGEWILADQPKEPLVYPILYTNNSQRRVETLKLTSWVIEAIRYGLPVAVVSLAVSSKMQYWSP
jgi:hypothetical protein